MGTSRLEAFSDGVLAIIITIMVLALEVPHEASLGALAALWPRLLSYVLSFVYVGIYWNNHHHLMHAAKSVDGLVLWANLHLLFWLSLLPFTTGWMGENQFGRWPMLVYGLNLLACALAYYGLQRALIRDEGRGETLARALGSDWKGKVSPVLYLLGIGAAWFDYGALSLFCFAATAILWLVPDRRIERALHAR
jgi:uncharacterized membrane protein